ncbi:universal stress protein [Streptomyces sp. NBRC 110028]|uniref:universal stress protein n=1 Tax=Streptomyces sp. NBRC 110028 TaxID=1621260 RepID=UPI0006E26B12|nr:universal stress protein [Streptomyces sp. NBRC 110028]
MAEPPMAHPITAGLDGSPESLAAAEWAAREARCRHAPLRLVHAWMPPAQTARGAQAPEMRKLRAQEALEEAKAHIADRYPEVPVSVELIPRTAVDGLAGHGASSQMLVLGSHARGAVAGYLLGSVGLRVLTCSTSPVVMVRGAGEPERTGPGAGEVVVGVQDPPESAAPIEFAFATAAAHGTGVRAVRALAPPVFTHGPRTRPHPDHGADIRDEERRLLAEAVELWREKYPDVPVTERAEHGHAADVLLAAAPGAGLAVVGRHTHRPPVAPRLGHVTHALLHHAACPVAVVPHD